jgi:hypothetical protein
MGHIASMCQNSSPSHYQHYNIYADDTPDGNGASKPANPTDTRLKWGGFGKKLDPPGLMGRVWRLQTRTHRPANPF